MLLRRNLRKPLKLDARLMLVGGIPLILLSDEMFAVDWGTPCEARAPIPATVIALQTTAIAGFVLLVLSETPSTTRTSSSDERKLLSSLVVGIDARRRPVVVVLCNSWTDTISLLEIAIISVN
jgi:hypothetical protein